MMKPTKFNAFDYFESDEEILDYLNDCYNDDDPRLFVLALSKLVQKKGVADVAKLTGLSREQLDKTINGTSEPSWTVIARILNALKITPTFHYA